MGRDVEVYKQASAVQTEASESVKAWDVELSEGTSVYTYVVAPYGDHVWMSAAGTSFEENSRFSHAVRRIGTGTAEKTTAHVEIAPALSGSESAAEQEANQAQLERFMSDETTCLFYYLDTDVFNEVLAELGQHQMDVTTFKGNQIAGTFEASESGSMLLTVPYDAGWTVKVNGEQVAATSVFDGAMMAIPVGEGSNAIELTYVSPGFIPGCVVSVATVMALAIAALHNFYMTSLCKTS